MKLCIRAHDLGVMGVPEILNQLDYYGIDGTQLVCYKAIPDILQKPGSITPALAIEIGQRFANRSKSVDLVGAYFNPIHENKEKVNDGMRIFSDYLRVCNSLGCDAVGSETGSCNNDSWTYNPNNRTERSLQKVVGVFSQLAEIAADAKSYVALEGCYAHICYDIETLAKARKMIGYPTRVVFDLYNYLDTDNQGDYLRILDKGLDVFAGDIQVFHMKDCILQNGRTPLQTPFGKGELDLRKILRRIKSYSQDSVLVLEETTGNDINFAVKTIRNIWESV